MSLQNVIYSSDLVGTSSSGVSPITYARPWAAQKHEDVYILLAAPKLLGHVNLTTQLEASVRLRSHLMSSSDNKITMWLDKPQVFGQERRTTVSTELEDFYLERRTTVSTELEDFYKTVTLSWQKRKIADQLDALAQMEDNSDESELKKPTESTLTHAKLFIQELLDSVSYAGYPWLMPFISSDEDGYITVEWHKGARELHFDIEENEAEYTKLWGPNTNMKIHSDILNRDDYLTLWEWLLDG